MADTSRRDAQILGLARLGDFLTDFLQHGDSPDDGELGEVLNQSFKENPWFTLGNQKIALEAWAKILTTDGIRLWLESYPPAREPKRVGLILAGNIPLVGLHDVVCTVLSGNIPVIKLSSKDRRLIPFLLKKWQIFSDNSLEYYLEEKLTNYDAVIATGSNNTARYLEYYFKDCPALIRKNRTSVAVLDGGETDEELRLLGSDIFTYFGMGCRNVTRLFLPENFSLDRIFENLMPYSDVINHHKYANNYDYNKAVYLLNRDAFFDNNFLMLREDDALFSPLSVINFSRYGNLAEVSEFIARHHDEIQCVVAKKELGIDCVNFGQAQFPALDTYADNVNTMDFLFVI